MNECRGLVHRFIEQMTRQREDRERKGRRDGDALDSAKYLDGLRLAVSAGGLLGLAQTLDQVDVSGGHATVELATSASVEQVHQLALGQVQQLRDLQTAIEIAAERATALILNFLTSFLSLDDEKRNRQLASCVEVNRD
jgi:hypothetical protein